MDTERLIAEVRRRDPLYNPLYPGYTDRDMKERLWREVGEIMRAPARECKTRWKTVRDSFQREIKAQQKMQNGGGPYKRKRYIFFDQLMFLLPNIGHRRTATKPEISYDTVESSDPDGRYFDEESSSSSSIQDVPTSPTILPAGVEEPCVILSSPAPSNPSSSSTTRTQTLKRGVCEHCRSPLFDERLYALLEASFTPPDEDELYVKSLLPSLKRLKNHDKSVIKIRVSQMIHEALYGTRY